MVSRTNRKRATDLVRQRSERLSQDLLTRELALFQRLETMFVAKALTVRTDVEVLLEGNTSAIVRARVTETVTASLTTLIAESLPAFNSFLGQVDDLALASIGDELIVCEQLLGSRYSGAALTAVQRTKPHVAALQLSQSEQFKVSAMSTTDWFAMSMTVGLRTSASEKEPPELILRRLFSPEPVKLPGHGGRGIWWGPYQTMTAAARGVQFETVNTLREHAMTVFNEICGEMDT